MTVSTTSTARAHHGVAAHAVRFDDKGQPLPDDGSPFAQLLADGMDDGTSGDALPGATGGSSHGLKALQADKQDPQAADASPDASTMAAWIGQTLGQHAATAATDVASPTGATANPADNGNALLSAKSPGIPGRTAGDQAGSDAAAGALDDASAPTAAHPTRHGLLNPSNGLTPFGTKPLSGSLATLPGRLLPAAAAGGTAATSAAHLAAPPTSTPQQLTSSAAAATAAAGPAAASVPANAAPGAPANADPSTPVGWMAVASDKGGAQAQTHTGTDSGGGGGQQSFLAGANTDATASSNTAADASGTPGAPTFSQTMNQAFDALGAQINVWSDQQIQRASMDLDTGTGTTLKVDVTLHEGTVQLHFKTNDPATRDALNQNATSVLGDMLSRNGIDLGGVSVGAQNAGQQNASSDNGGAANGWNGLARALNAAGGGASTQGVATQVVRSDRALDLYA